MSAPFDQRPLRVVVLDHTAQLGGAELALVRLVGALGADVSLRAVLFEDGPLADRLRDLGVLVDVVALADAARNRSRHAVRGLGAVRAGLALIPFVVRLARRLRALDADVVHATSLKAGVLGSAATVLARVPLVWYVHDRLAADYLPTPVAAVLRALLRTIPRVVVANSRATAATLGRRDAVIAYPGFAPEQVRPDASERAEPAAPTVGLVGRVSPTKGQFELVRAVPAVLAAVPDATFRLVGDPLFGAEDYARTVDDEIVRLGIADRVRRVAHVDDVAGELDGLTVLVHASPVPEPFGQVVVEAMVRGVPVVATDAGGVPEILRDESVPGVPLGLLVPPGDVAALAASLVKTLTDRDGRTRRAQAAYASALRRLPVAVTARTVTDAWRRAAGPRRSRRA